MQSTGQLDLQVPQAMQVSKIFLGIDNPPSFVISILCNSISIVLEMGQNVNDFFFLH